MYTESSPPLLTISDIIKWYKVCKAYKNALILFVVPHKQVIIKFTHSTICHK